jgi:hypothetical protein
MSFNENLRMSDTASSSGPAAEQIKYKKCDPDQSWHPHTASLKDDRKIKKKKKVQKSWIRKTLINWAV